MKKCPFCAEAIQEEAILCRFCGSRLPVSPSTAAPVEDVGAGVPLLAGEAVVADLERGVIQRATQDLFLRRTVVLTTERLMLLDAKFGSSARKFIFLRDVTGIESRQHFDVLRFVSAAVMGIAGLALVIFGFAHIQHEGGSAVIVGVALAAIALWAFLKSQANSLTISTPTEQVDFLLGMNPDSGKVETFVSTAQQTIRHHKR